MDKVKVTRKYQVTIPKEVREKVSVRIGDELLIRNSEQRIILEKPVDLEDLAGAWTHIESTDEFMKDARQLWKSWRME